MNITIVLKKKKQSSINKVLIPVIFMVKVSYSLHEITGITRIQYYLFIMEIIRQILEIFEIIFEIADNLNIDRINYLILLILNYYK